MPLVVTILAVASAEEIFFRGYLQNRLGQYCSIWRRILLVAVAMTFYKSTIHFWSDKSLLSYVELFAWSSFLNIIPSLWMERSGSLIGPLVLHVAWDLLVYGSWSSIPPWIM